MTWRRKLFQSNVGKGEKAVSTSCYKTELMTGPHPTCLQTTY